MRAAFYITVDDRYLGIGQAQAQRLHRLWEIDVHLLVEGVGGVHRDEMGQDGVFVHRNLMRDLIPQDLPATKNWPRIVYGRIFAPYVLPQYDRLIFLDADIYPLSPAPDLLTIDLPGGIAAVQDGSTIAAAPHTVGLTRDAWRRNIGLETQRYFNAGVMMFDHAAWIATDFRAALTLFMEQHGAVARMQDQDFLNNHFQGRWTELSPRFNYQKAHFNYGYEQLFPPVFLHFSSFQKPWLKPDHPDSVHGQFFPIYRDMFSQAGVDYQDYLQAKRDSFLRRWRTALRYRLSRAGWTTSKEKRQRSEWSKRSKAIFEGIAEDGRLNRYADMSFSLSEMPQPELSFDGRYLRRALNLEIRRQ
ncbi:glycosyltransferase family 8 protein [Paracoccus aminovorans]|uniref:glycosyltransferase family 8 protein n=1 Tax=Paracoccus aminovorans TaxID=34004 RepID=UPI002B25EE1F|nr:glycosyltransferase [Paracoccus aminovorans]